MLEKEGEEDPNQQIIMAVLLCKLQGTANQEKMRLQIAMKTFPARAAVTGALRQAGAEVQWGQAPPGYMEEELQDWVEAVAATLE